MLSWQAAVIAAGVLFGAGWVMLSLARPAAVRYLGPFVREAGVVLALYALWQVAAGLSLGHVGDAVRRGDAIWRFERAWHLPNEASVQHGIVHHPLLVQVCNLYYATMHFGMLIAVLVWVFARHRDAYPRLRMMIVLTTASCLLIGMIPVAPPRLVHLGMVDTAAAYGQSVYTVTGAIGADQYSAMPSVHVAWAMLVAVAVISISRSRWRWLILAHTAATVYVVVATANHYWLDGIVATALLGGSLAVQSWTPAALRAGNTALRARRPTRAPLPVPRTAAAARPPELAPTDDVSVG